VQIENRAKYSSSQNPVEEEKELPGKQSLGTKHRLGHKTVNEQRLSRQSPQNNDSKKTESFTQIQAEQKKSVSKKKKVKKPEARRIKGQSGGELSYHSSVSSLKDLIWIQIIFHN